MRPAHLGPNSGPTEPIEPTHALAPTIYMLVRHFTSDSPTRPRFQSHSASEVQDRQRPLIQG